ncbi:MAG: PAS domain S-box protein, partial [Candidatus Deferrimicrobium sp.]
MAQRGNLPQQRQCSAPPAGTLNLRADAVKDITGSGDLLRSLLNNIPGIVYRGMPDWSLTFIGGEVERFTGYTSREMLGESTLWRSLIHPDDIDPVCESIRNAVCRQERILRVECRIVRKDGELRWVSDRRQMIYDEGGRLLCIDGLCLDISEQKRAEEERRRLAAAVEYAADAIMITDAEWIVQYVNPAFEKVTGYAKEEALGRNPYIFAADGKNIRFYLGIKEKIRSGSPWKGRLKNRRKDGVHLEQDIVISPIRDPGGKVVNHVVAARDITREAFLQKQAQAAQRMEAVGTLAGGIAHDFNNALTGIIGFADLLRMRLEKEPKLQGDVDEILKCAE